MGLHGLWGRGLPELGDTLSAVCSAEMGSLGMGNVPLLAGGILMMNISVAN